MFARQQRSAQLRAVGEFGLAGLDLGADPLVVLLQQLHRGDIPEKSPAGVVRSSPSRWKCWQLSGMVMEEKQHFEFNGPIF